MPDPSWVRRYDGAPTSPWRNGGGTTRELLSAPTADGETFLWRLSVADVTDGGPFSHFPGIDRTLVLCRGVGMQLVVDGHPRVLRLFEPVTFSGELPAAAVLADGPTVDLNVMTRRGAAEADVTGLVVDHSVERSAQAATTTVLVVLEGLLELTDPPGIRPLAPFDAVVLTEPGHFVKLVGSGRMLHIDLRSRDTTSAVHQ